VTAKNGSRHVAWYSALALTWSWAALGFAWLSGASATEPPTSWLRLIAGIGPVLATAILLRSSASHAWRRSFWRRVIDFRAVGPRWWAVIVATAAGPGVIVCVAAGQREFDVSGVGAVAGVIAFAAAASFAEEPGWRGYALDGLGDRRWRAVAVISIVWAIWHLPLYAIDGTFQHDDVGFGTTFFWIIQTGFLPQTMLMIWILGQTRPSILPAVVFHALVNVSGEIFEYTTAQQAARLGVWFVLAGGAVLAWATSTPAAQRVMPVPGEPRSTRKVSL
jgi:hypothetical protein